MFNFPVLCDLDHDGTQDFSIIFKNQRNDPTEYQSNVFLLMYSDLSVIDGLDGEEDFKVDISVLWPED